MPMRGKPKAESSDRINVTTESLNVSRSNLEVVAAEHSAQDLLKIAEIEEKLGVRGDIAKGYEISKQHFGFERNRLAKKLREARKDKLPELQAAIQKEIQDLYEGLSVRSVEQIAKDTGALFVHTLLDEEGGNRHGGFTNVSKETTEEDDLDILLSLQPSISASSIIPGRKGKLWGVGQDAEGGVVIGDGYIGQADSHDLATKPTGLKQRGSVIQEGLGTKENLLAVVRREGEDEADHYNEIAINEPHAVAYFQRGFLDESGTVWIHDSDTESMRSNVRILNPLRNYRKYFDKNYREQHLFNRGLLVKRINAYREKFKIAEERGLPGYVMTQDQRLYKIHKVNDNGTLQIGEELTPVTASHLGGLSDEQRKRIGDRLLGSGKQLFRGENELREAGQIVQNLGTDDETSDDMRMAA